MCNRQKKGCRVARGEQQLFHAGYALERVHIDIMGPLVETQKGNKYILVIVDQFTKWVEAFPLKNQLAETVAGVVVREFVARFGCPLEIHTDQGRNFESELFKEMCALLEIGKTRTTSYRTNQKVHPRGNWPKVCKKAEEEKEGTKMVGSICLG